MNDELNKLLRNGFEYDERHNSYNGTCRIVGINWKSDLEQKLKDYFQPWERKEIETKISLPILNNLTPTILSCTKKVLEEVGELMQLLGKEQGESGETQTMTKLKWAVLTVCESIDTAQSAITLAHTLCKEYNLDLEELMELHESKLKEKGYLK